MGNIGRKLIRPIKNYNIENRAHRALEKQTKSKIGKAAPKHISHIDPIEHTTNLQHCDNDNHTIDDKASMVNKKDEGLVSRVGAMNIETASPSEDITSKRPLPTSTQPVDVGEYGFHIPKNVPRGRLTLAQVLAFLSRYKEEHPHYTVEDIAKEYHVSKEKISAIIDNFNMLNIFLPKAVLDKLKNPDELKSVSKDTMNKLTSIQSGVTENREKLGDVSIQSGITENREKLNDVTNEHEVNEKKRET